MKIRNKYKNPEKIGKLFNLKLFGLIYIMFLKLKLNITRHFVKGIRNKIVKASKLVRCSLLGEWLNTIVNMLWWSLATAKG